MRNGGFKCCRHEGLRTPMEFRCPKCQALTFSRRTKICGQCGMVFPPESVLTDEKAEKLLEERRWARELADKFGSGGADGDRRREERISHSQKKPCDLLPEELLEQTSYADAFRRRPRPHFWLSAIGYVFPFLSFGLM